MVRRIGLIAVLAAALFASTGVARADAPANVFSGVGVFVDNPQDFPDPETVAGWLQAAHFTWIAMHVDDVQTLDWTNTHWIEVMREHGLRVGAWGVESYNPIAGAAVADLAIRTYGFDFYIADAEGPYEKIDAGNGYWRSAFFVRAFRALQPTIPAALVTLGAAKAPWVLPINFGAWRTGGFDLLPEAYYNQYPGYRPDLTVAHALRAGWAIGAVHPVIGVYHHYPAAKYVPLLQALSTRGFSVFLGDQMTPADYSALSGVAAATVAAG
ncbi:MAG TPA: hypothetical protein VFW41_03330 [Gaiellaceae bacterium]|nr:hypothetical protein [Gaiellaceae bacterium]